MGYLLSGNALDGVLSKLAEKYDLWAPRRFQSGGGFSDTDRIRYGKISSINDIVFDRKSDYSFKESILPISQTLFYFINEQSFKSSSSPKEVLVFLRSCDLHGVTRLDDLYLRNGDPDSYYARVRPHVRFALIGCPQPFASCFCVDIGTNRSTNYDFSINAGNGDYQIDCKFDEWDHLFANTSSAQCDASPAFVTETPTRVRIPEELSSRVASSKMWEAYDNRCIGCGRCNFVCPTCTCFSMQDLPYTDNDRLGERRRVWASCMVDGFTDVAGGGGYRRQNGQRMRFKTLHKVLFHKKRFGHQMCVGCGRCDDICPEYISFSHILNRLSGAMEEVTQHDGQ